METILLTIILLVGLAILYFQIKAKPKQEENVTEKIKDELNSIKTSFSDSFGTMSRDIAKDMTGALTKVDEKVLNFNQQIQTINESQNNFSRILAGVKQYGGLSEFSLASILGDLLPASQYIANAKMKPDETRDLVEFAVKLQNNILCPIDSHWPIEKYKAVDEAFQEKDKEALAAARHELASAFRTKSKNVSQKYINPPMSTDFAIIYVPTAGLYAELSSYRDPKTNELIFHTRKKSVQYTGAFFSIPQPLAEIQAYATQFFSHCTAQAWQCTERLARALRFLDGVKNIYCTYSQTVALDADTLVFVVSLP